MSIPVVEFDATRVFREVPSCLRGRRQWVCWRFIARDGKATKCPMCPTGRRREASSTDPATWSTFDQAIAACKEDQGLAGIGFVFSKDDPFAGIDLDNCLDTNTGEMKPWARSILEQLDSYGEMSPSGRGVKVWVRASKPGRRCKIALEDGHVEIYDRARFFTVTGRRVAGTPAEVNARQDAVNIFYQRLFEGARSAPPSAIVPSSAGSGLTDDEIIQKASRSRSGEKFRALWAGEWQAYFGSQSEADSSLVFALAFYTKDTAQIDRIFRRSALMREKWDERRGAQTYGQITIDNALEEVTAQYEPGRSPPRSDSSREGDDGVATNAPGLPALGTRDPATDRIVLSPKRTLPTARAFVEEFHSRPQGRTLHSYAGTLMVWRGNRFVEIEEETLRQRLQSWLHDALRVHLNMRSGEMELVDFESNPGTIQSALESIRAYAHLPATTTPPCWLDRNPDRPDPRYLLAFPSGTLDLATGTTLSPTPALFNINAIDFEYDPNPPPPTLWKAFLSQLWSDDVESIELLQEWMGYCLVADTSQQKMLLMVGPKRSGKGTIGRVLRRLVGAGNVVGPTTSSLAGPFGLQPLVGKSLAIVSDARFTGEHVGIVVERLLCISGEDTLTVDRKFLGSVTMKLPTRFVFLTNELPRMNDASGALAGRFVILRLIKSFYGNENPRLTQQLMAELPGILVWAIEGLNRLRARGRFVQPEAVSDAVQEMEDLASPVLAFVRDCCEVGAGQRTWIDDMYEAWKWWCERDGRSLITSRQVFGRDLAAAVPGVACRRHSMQGRFYDGIGLRSGGVI